jgi:purine-cytosine permease-like protein
MKSKRPYWWWTFIGWFIATFFMGTLGALGSPYLGVPNYFGGTFLFCLTGMVGLFALAARVARKQ